MKHAYLIIAYKNPTQLQTLITLLDDSRNDIYLMLDKKSSISSYHRFHTNFSTLYYIKPIKIYWGSYSLVQAEINLFAASIKENYAYYHLLSGNDLPLTNQDIIHNYLDQHPNKEFIQYQKDTPNRMIWKLQPHLFPKHFRSTNFFYLKINHLENHIYKHFQFKTIPLKKISFASEWLTIDNTLAHLIVNKAPWIKKNFKQGIFIDELFIPTLLNYYPKLQKRINDLHIYTGLKNSPKSNLRYIRKYPLGAHPITFTYKNLNELMRAQHDGYFFARKFDSNKDDSIIKQIFNNIMG